MRNGSAKGGDEMSHKTKAMVAVAVASMTIAAAPLASLAVSGGTGVQLACAGGSGGGCAG